MRCKINTFKIIEPSVENRLEELLELEKEGFEPEVGATRKESLERYLKNQDFLYAAEVDRKMVGYISGAKVDSKRAEVTSIVVLKDYRKEGIANELMKIIHDRMREEGLKRAGLTVGVGWKPAINLYVKRGYNKITGKKLKKSKKRLKKVHDTIGLPRKIELGFIKRRLKSYYPTGEDAYRFMKDLKTIVRN